MLISEQVKMSTDELVVSEQRKELGIWFKHDVTLAAALAAVEFNTIPKDMTAFQAAYELVYLRCVHDETPEWAQEVAPNMFNHPRLLALDDGVEWWKANA